MKISPLLFSSLVVILAGMPAVSLGQHTIIQQGQLEKARQQEQLRNLRLQSRSVSPITGLEKQKTENMPVLQSPSFFIRQIQLDIDTAAFGFLYPYAKVYEITGINAVLNCAGALMYSGGTMNLQAGKTVTNQGAKMESIGSLSIKAPQIANLNDSFSAKRIGSAWITNPEKIRIDEAGHPERGQAFNKREFDNFDSGYGAHHRNSAASSYPINALTIIRTHSQTSEKQVQTTNAGVIRSGGHMTIDGSLHNDNSQIAAGHTLTVRNGTVTNTATENQKLTVTFGTTQASYTERHSRFHKGKIRKYNDSVFMTPQVEKSNPIPLGIAAYQENTQTRPDSKDITKTIRGHAQKFLDPFSIDSSGTNATPAQWKQTASGLSSSLYKLHPETMAKYLIETDSAFTNKHKFLSSDYMYEQMKWYPEMLGQNVSLASDTDIQQDGLLTATDRVALKEPHRELRITHLPQPHLPFHREPLRQPKKKQIYPT